MELAAAVLIIFIGSYVQTSIGFGLAIITAPTLFLINPLYVPAPITICALTLSFANSYSHRKSISLGSLKYAVIGRLPGTVAGAGLLLIINQSVLALWVGFSVLLGVLLSLKNVHFRATNGALVLAGFLNGFMGTSTSIGGPPMALVLQHEESSFIRANLAAFFVISFIMSLLVLGGIGKFGEEELMLALPLLPTALLAHWLALQTLQFISKRFVRGVSLTLCTFSGCLAIGSYWI